ncbi:helix-turn-helix domain-containing protein [Mucilaginibacter sp. UYCu711]|uniref:helix-turn-helix domain-containing protein n=1 Tax=Mucilaginibacter sp. UYCu711 TaxID=3156339 RepID=UPI003D1BE1A2
MIDPKNLNFPFYRPIKNELKRYIDYYYFFKSDDPAFNLSYISFPNINTAINIHRGVSFDINNSSIRIQESDNTDVRIFATEIRKEPLLIEWRGRLNKITIAFKPLGLCNFVRSGQPLTMKGQVQLFETWEDAPGYKAFCKDIYLKPSDKEKVDVIETFLLSIFQPSPEQQLLEKAIMLLTDETNQYSINDVAALSGLHVRTLIRLFNKNLGVPPVKFKQIARFRKSMENKLFADRLKKLTDLAYENNYYDQSYFIKVYTKLTGTRPKSFFDAVDKLGNDKLIFQFLKSAN